MSDNMLFFISVLVSSVCYCWVIYVCVITEFSKKSFQKTQTWVKFKPTTWKFALQYTNHCSIRTPCVCGCVCIQTSSPMQTLLHKSLWAIPNCRKNKHTFCDPVISQASCRQCTSWQNVQKQNIKAHATHSTQHQPQLPLRSEMNPPLVYSVVPHTQQILASPAHRLCLHPKEIIRK